MVFTLQTWFLFYTEYMLGIDHLWHNFLHYKKIWAQETLSKKKKNTWASSVEKRDIFIKWIRILLQSFSINLILTIVDELKFYMPQRISSCRLSCSYLHNETPSADWLAHEINIFPLLPKIKWLMTVTITRYVIMVSMEKLFHAPSLICW